MTLGRWEDERLRTPGCSLRLQVLPPSGPRFVLKLPDGEKTKYNQRSFCSAPYFSLQWVLELLLCLERSHRLLIMTGALQRAQLKFEPWFCSFIILFMLIGFLQFSPQVQSLGMAQLGVRYEKIQQSQQRYQGCQCLLFLLRSEELARSC